MVVRFLFPLQLVHIYLYISYQHYLQIILFQPLLLQILSASLLSLTSAAYKGPLAGGQPASLYPAGLDPSSCPNFPLCTNPSVSALPGYQLKQPTAAYQSTQNFQPQQPYQHRHTAAPVTPPQKYSQPEYKYVPNSVQAPQFAPSQQYALPAQHAAPQQYAPPQYHAPSSRDQQYTPEQKRALDKGEYIGDGDYHGEGLVEALAPEYVGKSQGLGAYSTPQHQGNVVRILNYRETQFVRKFSTYGKSSYYSDLNFFRNDFRTFNSIFHTI